MSDALETVGTEMVEVGLGPCFFCQEPVTEKVPFATSFTFEKPLICLKCRKGLLKLIRPDLERAWIHQPVQNHNEDISFFGRQRGREGSQRGNEEGKRCLNE